MYSHGSFVEQTFCNVSNGSLFAQSNRCTDYILQIEYIILKFFFSFLFAFVFFFFGRYNSNKYIFGTNNVKPPLIWKMYYRKRRRKKQQKMNKNHCWTLSGPHMVQSNCSVTNKSNTKCYFFFSLSLWISFCSSVTHYVGYLNQKYEMYFKCSISALTNLYTHTHVNTNLEKRTK